MPRCVAQKTRSFSKKHQIDLIFNVSKYHSHQLNESFQPDFFRNALLPTRGDDIAERGRTRTAIQFLSPLVLRSPVQRRKPFQKRAVPDKGRWYRGEGAERRLRYLSFRGKRGFSPPRTPPLFEKSEVFLIFIIDLPVSGTKPSKNARSHA